MNYYHRMILKQQKKERLLKSMNLLFIKLMFITFCFLIGFLVVINIIMELIIKYWNKLK